MLKNIITRIFAITLFELYSARWNFALFNDKKIRHDGFFLQYWKYYLELSSFLFKPKPLLHSHAGMNLARLFRYRNPNGNCLFARRHTRANMHFSQFVKGCFGWLPVCLQNQEVVPKVRWNAFKCIRDYQRVENREHLEHFFFVSKNII